jgi:hypothetical protein
MKRDLTAASPLVLPNGNTDYWIDLPAFPKSTETE